LPNNYLESISYSNEEDKKTYTYLEMRKLDEGEVFGIHDIVFNKNTEDENQINP